MDEPQTLDTFLAAVRQKIASQTQQAGTAMQFIDNLTGQLRQHQSIFDQLQGSLQTLAELEQKLIATGIDDPKQELPSHEID